MSAFAGLRNRVRQYLPPWMQRGVWKVVIYAHLRPLDIFLQWAVEGVLAAFPGLGTPTALPLIGSSRGIFQGDGESDETFGARLIPWIQTWEEAGDLATLAAQIQAYLATSPTVSVVSRAGAWVTVHPDKSVTRVKPGASAWAWDWDSVSNPERNGATGDDVWWSDIWIIVTPSKWAITGTTLASLVGLWGTGGLGIGHAVPRGPVDAILALASSTQWKAAHLWIEAIIWNYDATLFDPAVVNAGNPDGTWGKWGKLVTGSYRPSRNPTARYWIPKNG